MRAQVPGDLYTVADGSQFTRHSGPELARDRLYVALGMAKGTYRFSLNDGFPYRDIFTLRGANVSTVQTIFVRWMLGFDFISAVDRVVANYDPVDRIYSIAFRAFTPYGRVEDTIYFQG